MWLDDVTLGIILIGLILYTVLGGADFGAGVWQLLAGTGSRGQHIRDHAHHAPFRCTSGSRTRSHT